MTSYFKKKHLPTSSLSTLYTTLRGVQGAPSCTVQVSLQPPAHAIHRFTNYVSPFLLPALPHRFPFHCHVQPSSSNFATLLASLQQPFQVTHLVSIYTITSPCDNCSPAAQRYRACTMYRLSTRETTNASARPSPTPHNALPRVYCTSHLLLCCWQRIQESVLPPFTSAQFLTSFRLYRTHKPLSVFHTSNTVHTLTNKPLSLLNH